MGAGYSSGFKNPTYAPLSYSVASPTPQTVYTIMEEKKNVTLRAFNVIIAWTEAILNFTVGMWIDGLSHDVIILDPVSEQNYYLDLDLYQYLSTHMLKFVTDPVDRPYLLKCRRLKIEGDFTGGVCTGFYGTILLEHHP